MADKTSTTVQVFEFFNGKNENDIHPQITKFQLINNAKYSTGFDYHTQWISKKTAVVSYFIDVRYVSANFIEVKK